MAEFGWRGDGSVAEWLFAEGYRFDFSQAVRLLEIIVARERVGDPRAAHVALGVGPDPDRELVRLRAAVGFAFPPREVAGVKPPRGDARTPELTTNFFALAGARAPLPDWVGELMLQQERVRDSGLRDFLDIFHHRLLSLLYRIRLQHRPWLDPAMLQPAAERDAPRSPRARNAMAGYLFSFMGLGHPELRERMAVGDEELLPYAGLLWHEPRSAKGLQRLLEYALGVPVAVREQIGVWRRIEPEDRTRIGRRARGRTVAQSNRLGQTTVLGRRVWDAQGRVDLVLGPLRLAQFESFLPRGSGYRRARALVRFYAGEMVDVHLELLLEPKEVPGMQLNRSRLSQTTWLRPSKVNGPKKAKVPLLA